MFQDQVFNSLTDLDNYAESLTVQSFFIAGSCYALTGEPLDTIVRYLTYIQNKVDTDKISEDQKKLIEYEIFKGRLPKARELISQFKHSQSHSISQQVIPVPLNISSSSKSIKSLEEAKALEAATLNLLNDLKFEEQKLYKIIREQEEEKQRESLRMANEIEKQFERDLAERLKTEQIAVKCEICGDVIITEDIFALDCCTHIYHKDCISSYVENEIHNKVFPIVCPSKSCSKELVVSDIRELVLQDLVTLYLDTSFYHQNQDIEGLTCCPTPDCRFQFEWIGDNPKFSCPLCNIDYCMDCKCEYHAEMSCENYRAEYFRHNRRAGNKLFEEFEIGRKYKQCPQCSEWIEKNNRTNNLDCKCGYMFCYSCGKSRNICKCGKTNVKKK